MSIVMLNTELLKYPEDILVPKNFESLYALTKSIKKDGLLHEIIVCKDSEDDSYLIICGLKRVLACKLLDIKEVPCKIIEIEKGRELETRMRLNASSFLD